MKEINKQKEVGSMENDGIAAPGILLAQQSGTQPGTLAQHTWHAIIHHRENVYPIAVCGYGWLMDGVRAVWWWRDTLIL